MSGIGNHLFRKISLLRHLGAFAVLLNSSLFLHTFSLEPLDDVDILIVDRKTDVRFRFECNQVAIARVDPVVNPGGCAGHMHTFFGNANILKNTVATNDAGLKKENTNAQTTSCTAIQGSLYWAPSLYYKDPSDGKYKIANASVVAYYEFPKNTGEKLNPIPVGFRQLVGNAGRSTPFSQDELISTKYWPYFTCYDADDQEISGVSIEEFASAGQRCTRIEGTIIFRDCLKTANITDSANHKDHAAYAEVNQSCPTSHPFRIPRVRMQVFYELDLSYDLADVTLSTGLPSSSMHGDYIAGWDDQQKLIDAIESCELDEELEHNSDCSLKSEVSLEQPEYGTIAVDTNLLPSEEVTNIGQLQLFQDVGCPAGYGDSTQVDSTTSIDSASSSSPTSTADASSSSPAGESTTASTTASPTEGQAGESTTASTTASPTEGQAGESTTASTTASPTEGQAGESTTASTTASPTEGQARQVTGSLKLTVSDPTSFASNAAVKASLQQAIADNLDGISSNMVEIISVTAARRLSLGVGERRLAGDVTVQYKIMIPASATGVATPTTASMQSIQGNLKTSLTTRLSQNGVTGITVIAVVANAVQVADPSTTTDNSSGANGDIVGGLLLASLLLVSSM